MGMWPCGFKIEDKIKNHKKYRRIPMCFWAESWKQKSNPWWRCKSGIMDRWFVFYRYPWARL